MLSGHGSTRPTIWRGRRLYEAGDITGAREDLRAMFDATPACDEGGLGLFLRADARSLLAAAAVPAGDTADARAQAAAFRALWPAPDADLSAVRRVTEVEAAVGTGEP